MTGALATIDVQDLAGHEAGLFEIEDGIDDVGGLAHVADRVHGADLAVTFKVGDGSATLPVAYQGILPDLFKEGRGCVAQGHIGTDGVFQADEVLAKHDENYMPPEAGQAIDAAKHEREAAKTVVPN